MTPAQKKLLRPYAELIARMDAMLCAASSDELQRLLKAARAVSQTNCWAAIYDAAPLVEKYAQIYLGMRQRSALAAEEKRE